MPDYPITRFPSTALTITLASQMTKEEEALALPGLDDKPDARSMRTRLANLD